MMADGNGPDGWLQPISDVSLDFDSSVELVWCLRFPGIPTRGHAKVMVENALRRSELDRKSVV